MEINAEWSPDTEFSGFETTFIHLTIDDVNTRATLIRDTKNKNVAARAVLYIHGYNDYFFHKHVAAAYRAEGYNFYALDLHGYGRSIEPKDTPNYCEDIHEYFPEIDKAIAIIKQQGCQALVVNAHSTGGLITSLYAQEGKHRDAIAALFLNSPFLDINVQGLLRFIVLSLAFIGRFFPKLYYWRNKPSPYAQSVHKSFKGEWDYNLQIKPATGFPAYFGWMNAIVTAQKKVQAGLTIKCPVLIMHSDRSVSSRRWSSDLLVADGVLNIDDMRRIGPSLGKAVELITIEKGMHDLMLSSEPVRDSAVKQLLNWLNKTL